MRNLVLLPEAVVVAAAVVLVVAGRLGRVNASWRRRWPAIGAGAALVALGVELWAGSTPGTFLGGALVQDRFALFAKAAALLTAALVLAATDWTAEDSPSVGVAMPLLAVFGVMVAASAGDLIGLWAGLELAAASAVVLVGLRRPDLGLRLLAAGAVASALILMGLAFVYATTGNSDLGAIRAVLLGRYEALPLVIPALLLIGGLAVRAGLAPFQMANLPAGVGASPLGAGLIFGLGVAAAITVAVKLTAALVPVPEVYSPFLVLVSAVAMVGGGAAALAVRSPRARLAYLAAGQVGWVVAGLTAHSRTGQAASLFLLGGFAVAATCGPSVLGRPEGGEAAVAGLGSLRPARAAAVALAMLSLAGAPPLAGFFGELAVAAALAQTGQFGLLALGLLGSVMAVAASIGTLRVLYIQSPPEESRRGPGAAGQLTALATAGTVAFCVVIAAYGLFGNPIMGLANQGAEALGLR